VWPFGRYRRTRPGAATERTGRRAATGTLGRRGEKLARRHLKRSGMKILATNYRCPAGEADLIAFDRSTRAEAGAETVAFVEVKTRSSDEYTDPASAVNADKQRRLRKIAHYYLATHPAEGLNVRFDIVSIVIRDGQRPQIDHIRGAF